LKGWSGPKRNIGRKKYSIKEGKKGKGGEVRARRWKEKL
jgi:hypothetical protein